MPLCRPVGPMIESARTTYALSAETKSRQRTQVAPICGILRFPREAGSAQGKKRFIGIFERLKRMLDRRGGYEYEDLLACGRGELFGPGNAQLPLPPMLMFDRISQISETGGEHRKGGGRGR